MRIGEGKSGFMALLFNDLLAESGIAPANVRLLRHHTQPGQGGISVNDLWAKDLVRFSNHSKQFNCGLSFRRIIMLSWN